MAIDACEEDRICIEYDIDLWPLNDGSKLVDVDIELCDDDAMEDDCDNALLIKD